MSEPAGGCLGKVDSTSLLRILNDAGLDVPTRSSFRDAEFTPLPGAQETALATSADLIYDFGLAAADFGWIAVTHALSDLYAVLATPLSATVSLGVPRESVRDGYAADVLGGAVAALKANLATLGGGHTVYAHQLFASVAVVGLQGGPVEISLDRNSDYTLMLSKALGSGVYISAMRNGLLASDDLTELLTLARTSNSAAATSIRDVLAAKPGSVGFVTDVTGFGLALGVLAKVSSGWKATIQTATLPLLSQTTAFFSDHGLTTTLGEQNMFTADREGVDFSSAPMHARLAVSDPQTSGGLIVAVKRDAVAQLEQQGDTWWTRVGDVRFLADSSPPALSIV